MQHKRTLWRGALISPWVMPVGMPILVLVAEFLTDGTIDAHAGEIILMFLFFGVPFTYLVTFLLVVPMALFLRAHNALSSVRLCVWCMLLGPLTMWGYAWLLSGQPSKVLELSGVLFTSAYGLISGACFCAASGIRLFVRNSVAHQA
jgi:hypothetical protein